MMSTASVMNASVDDSDLEEPFSPEGKTSNGQTLEGPPTPTRLYSVNYADEFGIGPSSPTRQFLRAGHSTTMEKLQKKASIQSQSTTLENVASRNALRTENHRSASANGGETEQGLFGTSLVSFRGRDGDALAQSSISLSSLDFAMPQNISPNSRLPFANASAVPTEIMSEEENPLHLLVHGQVSDGLPSTKASSGGPTTHPSATQPSLGGTQDDLAAAAQIGDDLLANMLNDHVVTMDAFRLPHQADDSQDELAQPTPSISRNRSANSNTKSSKKRARAVSKEDAEASDANKKHRLDEAADDDIFADMPVEHYQPRRSRSRAAVTDNKASADMKIASIPEMQKEHKPKPSRKQPVGAMITPMINVITIVHDDDEKSDEEAQQTFVPIKHRSKRKEHRENTEDFSQASEKSGVSQISELPQSKRGIIVVAAKQSQEVVDAAKTQQKTSKKAKKRGKKGTKKQELDESNHSQTNSQTVNDDNADAIKLAIQPVTETVNHTESQEKEEEKEAVQIGLQSTLDQAIPPDAAAPLDHVDEKAEQPSQAKKPKGKTKKRGRPKKSAVEVVDLPSSPITSPVKTTADEETAVEPQPLKEEPVPADPEPLGEEPPAQILSDKTNVATAEKPVTPEKPGTAPKHSPIKRVTYRVGLSRRSRIEPLLKIVRKEKDSSKDSTSKKKPGRKDVGTSKQETTE